MLFKLLFIMTWLWLRLLILVSDEYDVIRGYGDPDH